MGYVNEFLNNKYGGNVVSNDNPITDEVLTTITKLANNNSDRATLYIVNLGGNDIYVFFDETVALTKGYKITANGGTLVWTARDDGDLPTRELWGIADTVKSGVLLVEGVIK